MQFPILDKRDKKDILNQIKSIARQYVPEWNCDYSDPDFGVIFSKVFAEIFMDTINRYNRMPYNQYIEFLNTMGAKVNPVIPAEGMATVVLNENSDGKYLSKGEQLYATANNDRGRVLYETTETMFATNNELISVIVTDGRRDSINKVYKFDEENKSFRIFDMLSTPNLQKHEVYFENETVFFSDGQSDFVIRFYNDVSIDSQNNFIKIFLDKDNVVWQYFKDEKWSDIEYVEPTGTNGIRLKFESSTDKCTVNDRTSYFIRAVLKKIPSKELRLTRVECLSQNKGIVPDVVMLDMKELDAEKYFPFSEQYFLHNCFYIFSSEIFSKKGASVELAIDVKFLRTQRDKVEMPDMTQYRNLMSELDFKKPEPPTTEIQKVDWEYWNGKVWVKLFKNHDNDYVFSPDGDGEKIKKLKFICPEDIQSFDSGSVNAPAIRARISKIKNPYSVNGDFISPFVNSVWMRYSYEEHPRPINNLVVMSNLECKNINLSNKEICVILEKKLEDNPVMYLGFRNPIACAPVKLFVDITQNSIDSPSSLTWQYLCKGKNNGVSWQTINMVDTTNKLTKSGIITLIGKNNFVSSNIFGEEGYFVKVVNNDKAYSTVEKENMLPLINGMFFNTVGIKQIDKMEFEYFKIGSNEKSKVCKLRNSNVVCVEVYVNEYGNLPEMERRNILEDRNTIIENDEDGNIKEIWVKWSEVPLIKIAEENQRAYEFDYAEGKVIFGDNKHGRIPCSQGENMSIRVGYRTSEGAGGNIKERRLENLFSETDGVSSVTNLKPIIGGSDKETADECLSRTSKQICGMGRIISLEDFESQIMCCNRNIKKVRCKPHVNEQNEEMFGMISIAVLPIEFNQGSEKFAGMKNIIKRSLEDKIFANIVKSSKLSIFEVTYVKILVDVEAFIENYEVYQSVYQKIREKLEKFLNPVTGNFNGNGWDIGSIPKTSVIYNCIKSVKCLRRISSLTVFYKVTNGSGEKYVEESYFDNQNFVVPIFDDVEISLLAE